MSGEIERPEAIDSRVEKVVISRSSLKAILKKEIGRDVESVTFDEREELWTVDFLTAEEKPED